MFTKADGMVSVGKIAAWIILAIAGITFLSSFSSVDTGSVGIVTRFGAVQRTIGPGLHFVAPIDSVHSMDVQTQKEQAEATAASVDQQNVFTTVAVNYKVDAGQVASLYSNVGADYKARIVDPNIQEVVKAVTARYTANELLSKRPQVSEEIKAGLMERLAPYHLLVSDVAVVNFKYSDIYETAIEAKVTAEQNALAAKNKLDQVQYEAQQTVTAAKAQAESIQIQAQAIAQQGGANYVSNEAVKKWDGHLPQQMIPGGSIPFIKLP